MRERQDSIMHTLEDTISHERKRTRMDAAKMFEGLNKEEWERALEAQNEHLQENYNYQLDTEHLDPIEMNKKAEEAAAFLQFMATALKDNVSVNDDKVLKAIEQHVQFLGQDQDIDARSFAHQSRFYLSDEFHRTMLEAQQTGLSYYVCIAAKNYASTKK